MSHYTVAHSTIMLGVSFKMDGICFDVINTYILNTGEKKKEKRRRNF